MTSTESKRGRKRKKRGKERERRRKSAKGSGSPVRGENVVSADSARIPLTGENFPPIPEKCKVFSAGSLM